MTRSLHKSRCALLTSCQERVPDAADLPPVRWRGRVQRGIGCRAGARRDVAAAEHFHDVRYVAVTTGRPHREEAEESAGGVTTGRAELNANH